MNGGGGPDRQCTVDASGRSVCMKYVSRRCGARTQQHTHTLSRRLEHKSQLLKPENTDWPNRAMQHRAALGTSPNKFFSPCYPC